VTHDRRQALMDQAIAERERLRDWPLRHLANDVRRQNIRRHCKAAEGFSER
jgi:hypothetical protein